MNPSGEISIDIKGVSYRMRPSFKCLSRIEEATGLGVTKMVIGMSEGNIRFGHVAIIIHEAIKAGEDRANAPTLDDIGEWLLKGNMAAASAVVVPFFQEALTSGPKES